MPAKKFDREGDVAKCWKIRSESFDGAQDERMGLDGIQIFRSC